MTIVAGQPRPWCSFRVGGDSFAVATADVVEVLRSRRLTRVPLAAAGTLGLVHLRGRIVPVIDPAVRLGIGRAEAGGPAAHLVIAVGGDWYGLAVDEMLDVIEIPPQRVERPTAAGLRGEAVCGTYADRHRLVHLLDPERLIQPLVRPPTAQGIPRGGTDGSG